MRLPNRRRVALFTGGLALAALAFALSPFGRGVFFHLAPLDWTGEASRLARMLNLTPGRVVADIGAGRGDMAIEISGMVGPAGRVFVTERTAEQRAGPCPVRCGRTAVWR